jgi:hypothetical protein
MEAGKFSFKFFRQTQKNLVGSSKYAYFRVEVDWRLIANLNGYIGYRQQSIGAAEECPIANWSVCKCLTHFPTILLLFAAGVA